MDKFHRVSTTVIFYIYFALLPVWAYFASWEQIVITIAMYWFLADFVQSLFLHRWAAHELWNPPKWLQKALAFVGLNALVGTPIGWAAWHRTHHKYSDTEDDPHSPTHKGALYVTFWHKFHRVQLKRAVDRLREPFFSNLNKYEGHIATSVNLTLFVLISYFFGWQWFLTVWAAPVALTIFISNFFVNVLLHRKGEPIDNPWMWPFAFGECLHRKHHVGPMRLNYPGTWDPSGSLITLLGWSKSKASESYKDATPHTIRHN